MGQVESTVNNALEKAKQGDPQALEQLMSGPLKQKGIDVAVERKGALMFITLAGKRCPPKQGSLAYVRQGLQKLGVSGIDSVRLSGYQSGNVTPQWVERLSLRTGEGALALQQSPAVYRPQAQASAQTGSRGSQPSPAGALKKALLILVGLVVLLGAIGLALQLIRGQSPEPKAPTAEFFVQPETAE